MTRPGLAGAASLTPPPSTEAKRIGRGAASAGRRVLRARVAAERTQAGVCSHPSQADGALQTLAPQRPSAARASPGSKVQSNRGAVREMQLRFLSTLLRMVPTPPPPPPPWRFRHRPPRRREPVSLSCRIRERRPPPRCSLLLLLLLSRNDSARRTGLRRVQASEAPWRALSAQQPEFRSQEDQRELLSSERQAGICSAGAQTAETGAGWGGEEGGSELAGTQRRRRRLGTQSPHQPEQARRSEPRSTGAPRTETSNKAGVPSLLLSLGGMEGPQVQTAKCPLGVSSLGKARPIRYSTKHTSLRAEKLADGDLNLQPKLCPCLSRPLRGAKNHA